MSYQAQIWHVDSRPIVLQHIFRFCFKIVKNIDIFSKIFSKNTFNFGGQNKKICDSSLVALLILHLFDLSYFSLSSKL